MTRWASSAARYRCGRLDCCCWLSADNKLFYPPQVCASLLPLFVQDCCLRSMLNNKDTPNVHLTPHSLEIHLVLAWGQSLSWTEPSASTQWTVQGERVRVDPVSDNPWHRFWPYVLVIWRQWCPCRPRTCWLRRSWKTQSTVADQGPLHRRV